MLSFNIILLPTLCEYKRGEEEGWREDDEDEYPPEKDKGGGHQRFQ